MILPFVYENDSSTTSSLDLYNSLAEEILYQIHVFLEHTPSFNFGKASVQNQRAKNFKNIIAYYFVFNSVGFLHPLIIKSPDIHDSSAHEDSVLNNAVHPLP